MGRTGQRGDRRWGWARIYMRWRCGDSLVLELGCMCLWVCLFIYSLVFGLLLRSIVLHSIASLACIDRNNTYFQPDPSLHLSISSLQRFHASLPRTTSQYVT